MVNSRAFYMADISLICVTCFKHKHLFPYLHKFSSNYYFFSICTIGVAIIIKHLQWLNFNILRVKIGFLVCLNVFEHVTSGRVKVNCMFKACSLSAAIRFGRKVALLQRKINRPNVTWVHTMNGFKWSELLFSNYCNKKRLLS